MGNLQGLVHSLTHVINSQGGHCNGGQCLHLYASSIDSPSLDPSFNIRFIEYMPTNGLEQDGWYFSSSAVKEIVERKWGALDPLPLVAGSAARYFKVSHNQLVLGLISPISHPFCHHCTRLRLTAAGKLRLCLPSNQEIDLRRLLKGENGNHEIKACFDLAMEKKPKGRLEPLDRRNTFMFQIGG